VYKVVHENGNIASTQVSKGKPVQIGNYRLSVRYGDEGDEDGQGEREEELPQEESYPTHPTRQQRDAGPAYPSQPPAGDAHVFLKPGDVSRLPLAFVYGSSWLTLCGISKWRNMKSLRMATLFSLWMKTFSLKYIRLLPMPAHTDSRVLAYRSGIPRQEFSYHMMKNTLDLRKQ
jgi:hypothetical protein